MKAKVSFLSFLLCMVTDFKTGLMWQQATNNTTKT
jgi:hypothetical protein